SPAVFGKQYFKMLGVTEKDMKAGKKEMMPMMIQTLVVSIVTAYVFAHIIGFSGAVTMMDAIMGAFWVWLGFFATTAYLGVLYEKKSMEMWFIQSGYHLVSLIVMAIVILSV
ncbi:MAG: DUF1761 domain-containing protein, partial [archaeon]